MICALCGTRTMEQFHDSCLYLVEKIQTTTDHNQNGCLLQRSDIVNGPIIKVARVIA